MKPNGSWRIRLAQILVGAAIVIALVVVRGTHAGNGPVHLTTDWSHRHLIFSAPKNLGHHVSLLSNPRYVQQLLRRNSENKGTGDEWRWRRAPEPTASPLHGDWSMNIGLGATVGADNYPAKFSFNAGTANCSNAAQPDFVVYNTSLPGNQTGKAASLTASFSSSGTPSGTVTIAGTLVLTASTTSDSGNNFLVVDNSSNSGFGSTINAALLAGKVTELGGAVGVNATSSSNVVTITAIATGTAGNGITVTATLTDFSLRSGALAGGTNPQASIVAFDNLYSSCAGLVPTTYWAYNTGTTGAVRTSPVLSFQGDQVAFIQNTATASTLVLLKWAEGNGILTSPVDLTGPSTNVSAANYRGCAAPCMTTIAFSAPSALDTRSSPFYDYPNDALYVGDNGGYLHKFTGVFSGTPAEVVASGADVWPASVSPGGILTGAILETVTGRIFVGDNFSRLYRVDSTIGSGTGGIVRSALLGVTGLDDSPLVDSSTGMVYVFERLDDSSAAGRIGIYQFTTSFATNTAGNETVVSSDNTAPPTAFYAGNFDNIYYTGTGTTGNLYACSTNGGLTALWQIPLTTTPGVLGTPVAGPTLTTANVNCSPITEFNNGATDWMFLSVTASAVTASPVSCPSATGCIMSFDITTPTGWGITTATHATAAEAGGTSAIIVDGSSPVVGASQVYFTPLADQLCTTSGSTGGCAIQASQSGLE